MLEKCIWKLQLPFKIRVPEGMNFPIKIRGIQIDFVTIKNKEYCDIMEVGCEIEISNNMESEDLYNTAVRKSGVVIKEFINSLSKHLNGTYYTIFDGDDYVIPYDMECWNLRAKSHGDDSIIYTPKLKHIEDSIIETTDRLEMEIDNIGIVKDFLRYAEYFHEMGNFEMAIMNISMASECFIVRYISDLGISKNVLEKEFHKYLADKKECGVLVEKSFVDKYYDFGLKRATGMSLIEYNEDLFGSLKIIYRLRNKIAHGDNMYDVDFIKNENIEYSEMHLVVNSLLITVYDTINFVREIEISRCEGGNLNVTIQQTDRTNNAE